MVLARSRQNLRLFSFLCSLRKFRLRFIKVSDEFFCISRNEMFERGKRIEFLVFCQQILQSPLLFVLLSDLSAAPEPNLKPSIISLRLQCSVHFASNLTNFSLSSTSFSVYRSLSLYTTLQGPFVGLIFRGLEKNNESIYGD